MEGEIDLESPGIFYGDEVPDSYNVEERVEEKLGTQFSDFMGPTEQAMGPHESAPSAMGVEQEVGRVESAPSAMGVEQEVGRVGSAPPAMGVEQAVGRVESAPPAMGVEQAGGPVLSVQPGKAVEQAVVAMPGANGVAPGTDMKKKRGRPRKYGPDGKPLALSPRPISASNPLTGETWKPSKGVSVDLFKKKKKHKLEFGIPGSQVSYPVGANFTPHMITVNVGEDVSMKIISFSQQGSRVICILAANGSVSNVTLHQPNASGGTLTYEGHFEILSLSGSFMPTDSGGTKSRAGGMSVSLAGPDGRVLGGGLAGMLIAAGPVQVVIGSFLPGHQQEHKTKKHKSEVAAAFSPFPANQNSGQGPEMIYNTPQPSLTPLPYHGNNLSFGNPVQGSTILGVGNDISLSGGPTDLSQTKFMVSC